MKTPVFRLLSWFGFCSVILCCPVAGQTLFAPNASLGAVSNGEDYIGINTATPAARLSVNGFDPPVGAVWGAGDTILFHNGSIGDNGSFGQWWRWNVYREAGTNNCRYLDFSDRPNAAEIMMDGNIYFRTAAYTGDAGDIITMANRLVIKADGKIGIGTNSPTQELSVNGTIRAKEVLVEASPWPDDVFAPDYQLASVEEVAAHIETEGHLPGVPSAATVAENGVALGQMQQVLLRKVEELTLYVIQQQRINAAQAEKIRELEQRLNARPEQQPQGE